MEKPGPPNKQVPNGWVAGPTGAGLLGTQEAGQDLNHKGAKIQPRERRAHQTTQHPPGKHKSARLDPFLLACSHLVVVVKIAIPMLLGKNKHT